MLCEIWCAVEDRDVARGRRELASKAVGCFCGNEPVPITSFLLVDLVLFLVALSHATLEMDSYIDLVPGFGDRVATAMHRSVDVGSRRIRLCDEQPRGV